MSGREARVPTQERFVLSGLDYQRYITIADSLNEQPIRLTYDRGSLELMTLSLEHERYSYLIGLLVNELTVEMEIDAAGGGSTTFRKEVLDRGVEPDHCWWIEHEAQMRGRNAYDPDTDPPPDLSLEIEVSRNILNRLGILAALRVPEVWRFDGETLRVLLLGQDGQYHESPRSRVFPFLPVAELVRFVNLRTTHSDTAIVRAFREWLRDQKARGWPDSPSLPPVNP